jgi:protein O-mannosyl-transferase
MIEKAASEFDRSRGFLRESAIGTVARIGIALVPPLLLVLVTFVAFLPMLGNDFVAWDDRENFVANPSYRGLGLSNLAWASTTFHLGVYQPLAWVLFGLEYTTCGMNPRGYHLTSLVLHVLVGIALYYLTVRILARSRTDLDSRTIKLASCLATLVFLVHPLRVEAVAWVSCQGYLPCAFFAILSVLVYERSRPAGLPVRTGYFFASLAWFFLSLLCHATAIGLPLVLIILDFHPFRRFNLRTEGWRSVVEKWPFLLVAIGFTSIGYLAKGASVKSLEHHDILARVGQASYGAIFYVLKTLVPLGLHAHHPLPAHLSLFDAVFIGALAADIVITAVLIALGRRYPGLPATWLSYLAILAPSSGLISFGGQLVADRYAYLPMLAWSVFAAYALATVVGTRPRPAVGFSLLLIAGLSGLTWRQCLTWRDSTSLWTNVLAWEDSSPAAHLNLGNLLAIAGRDREALQHYQKAATFDPKSPDPPMSSAVLMARHGRLDEAEKYLEQALQRGLPPHEAHSWVALVLSDRGRTIEALPLAEQALRERPGSARVQFVHGTVLARLGRLEEAVKSLSRASELDPSLESARLSLGLALSDLGRLAPAEKALREVLRHNPASVPAHVGLGELLGRRGDLAGATRHFQQVVSLEPGNPRAAEGLRRIGGIARPGRAPK